MSLDVSLYTQDSTTECECPHCVSAHVKVSGSCVFDYNITHNLGEMADQAGIYKELWRPEELGIVKASQMISPLESGLKILKENPEKFKKLNPGNGWGSYPGLVKFVSEYLSACKSYPDSNVRVDR